jgi:hypothetical protein
MTNSLTTAAQNASPYSEPIKKDCKFCGKEGLLILPIRCSTLPKEAKAPTLPANIGQHVKDIPIGMSTYTLRTARVGYLYLLVNRKGALSWQCYISTATGYWSQFAADAPPLVPPEFSCQPDTHGINASMISILQAEDVQTAYMLFTPSPLTLAMLSESELKNTARADTLCAAGQMVKFSPAKWVKGTYKQDHCLDASGVAKSVAEFAIYDLKHPIENPLTQAMSNSTFPLMNDGHGDEGKSIVMAKAVGHLLRMGPLKDFMVQKKAVAVALYDPIGVAQELNDFRNDALNKVDDFLNQSDRDRVTNRWKFDTLHAIREVKTGYEKGLVKDLPRRHADTELHLHAMHEPIFPDDTEQMVLYKKGRKKYDVYRAGRDAWKKEFPEKARALEADLKKHHDELPTRMAKATSGAKAAWETKYATLLDAKAMSSFDTDFDGASTAATDMAAKRVDDHLAWVTHERFIAAFDTFDRDNFISGHHFEGQSALCTLGMVGNAKAAAQIDAWLKMPMNDRKNIYMRGLLLNQSAIEKEAGQALAKAADIASKAPTVSMIDGKLMYKALKGLIDFYKNADSAWDEFVRDRDQQTKPKFQHTREGGKLFKYAEINRAFFRKGITKLEMDIVGKMVGLLFSRLGGLAEKLTISELVYGIDPQSPHPNTPVNAARPARHPANTVTTTSDVPARPHVDPARAAQTGRQVAEKIDPTLRALMTDAEAQHQARVQGITYTADEYLAKNRTNNYHQVRVGALLGALETIALGIRLWGMRDGKVSKIEVIEASANLLSIIGIGYNTAYALTKSVREQTSDNVLRGAADISRGGFKMWAGAFGAVAGGFGVWADIAKLAKEQQGSHRAGKEFFLMARIFVGSINTTSGTIAAFSYSGPMLRRIEINLATKAAARRAIIGEAAHIAEWLSRRVFLLRVVAWGSLLGLALVAVEIGYEVYLHFLPSELEIWCKRCAFRDRSLSGNAYPSAEDELEEHAKARKLAGI